MRGEQDTFQLTSTMTSKGQVTVPKEVRQYLGVSEGEVILFKPTQKGVLIVGEGDIDTSAINTVKRLVRTYKRVQVTSKQTGNGKTHLLSKLLLDGFNDEKVLVVGRLFEKIECVGVLKGLDTNNNIAISHMLPEDFLETGIDEVIAEGYQAVVVYSDPISFKGQQDVLINILENTDAVYFLDGDFKEDSPFKSEGVSLDLNLTGRVREESQYNQFLRVTESVYNKDGVLEDEIRLL